MQRFSEFRIKCLDSSWLIPVSSCITMCYHIQQTCINKITKVHYVSNYCSTFFSISVRASETRRSSVSNCEARRQSEGRISNAQSGNTPPHWCLKNVLAYSPVLARRPPPDPPPAIIWPWITITITANFYLYKRDGFVTPCWNTHSHLCPIPCGWGQEQRKHLAFLVLSLSDKGGPSKTIIASIWSLALWVSSALAHNTDAYYIVINTHPQTRKAYAGRSTSSWTYSVPVHAYTFNFSHENTTRTSGGTTSSRPHFHGRQPLGPIM